MPAGLVVEVCVDSVESALRAEEGGADRVELCDNLLEGGTTPSAGAIAVARQRLGIRLHVIIRPRGGDFCYSETEMAIMTRDVAMARQLGADGVVIGALRSDGSVDTSAARVLVEAARPLSVTFHRAFDMARDPYEALDDVIALGCDRLLTTGQEPSILEGLELVAELVRRAGDHIVVMPGGGNERNIAKVAAATGAREFHVTGTTSISSLMTHRNPRVFMGGELRPPEYDRQVTDPESIRRLRERAEG
jgi:copper homeostasis protein